MPLAEVSFAVGGGWAHPSYERHPPIARRSAFARREHASYPAPRVELRLRARSVPRNIIARVRPQPASRSA
jgi:hypothetical protein